jgi:hypothetical protein
LQDIIGELPSAAGQDLRCGEQSADPLRIGVQSCSWNGVAPNVLGKDGVEMEKKKKEKGSNGGKSPFSSWVDYNVTAGNGTAKFSIRGRNTKSCRLIFDDPVTNVQIDNAASDPRYQPVAKEGSSQVRLFSREWDKTFSVSVSWANGKTKGRTGKVMCLWADANRPGVIPAFDEVRRFQPIWSAVTKGSDGLVEGWKTFEL